jgi:hypothetical protein
MFKYLNPIENVSIKIYKKLFESLVKPILMYNSEICYIDFYEKILEGQLPEIYALVAMLLTYFLLIPRTNLQNFKFTFSRKLVSNESMRSKLEFDLFAGNCPSSIFS